MRTPIVSTHVYERKPGVWVIYRSDDEGVSQGDISTFVHCKVEDVNAFLMQYFGERPPITVRLSTTGDITDV